MQNSLESIKYEVFICVTPLQMLIAESIVALQKEESGIIKEYTFIIITYDDNEKYKYYSDRLRKLSSQFLYFVVKGDSKFSRFGEVSRFKKSFNLLKKKSFDVGYLASIENPFVLYSLSVLNCNRIETFDDGTANIDKSSIYYRNLNRSFFEKVLKRFLGITYTREDVVLNSSLHYTLYKGCSNIIKNVFFIDLMKGRNDLNISNQSVNLSQGEDSINIFLGQPIIGIDSSIDIDFVQKVIKKSGATYYLPHPRERITIDDIEYINTSLILEDFILVLKQKYPNTRIILNTFFSSAVLNILSLDNIDINVYANEYLIKEYYNIYDLYDLFEIKKIIL